jgi:Ca2+-binding EF-hand superfamily protein
VRQYSPVTVSDSLYDTDNEFTQLMKGLQGERLRQAFKYLDKDEDGFIRPDQFKQIILVGVVLLTNG